MFTVQCGGAVADRAAVDPRGANSDPTDVFRANKKHENIQKLGTGKTQPLA